MRVFLADHHILFREGIIGLLSADPDIEVVGGTGAAGEVVERVAALQPDILLLDPAMADGGAVEILRGVRKCSPKTQTVILTVEMNDQQLLSAVENGAKGFLLKDVPTRHLIEALKAVLRDEAALTRSMTRRIIDSIARRTIIDEHSSDFNLLTDREKEVLEQICGGASNQEIAACLQISENTVKAHVRKILSKLNLQNRREAKQMAIKHGFVSQISAPSRILSRN